jgi:hypothetical protein
MSTVNTVSIVVIFLYVYSLCLRFIGFSARVFYFGTKSGILLGAVHLKASSVSRSLSILLMRGNSDISTLKLDNLKLVRSRSLIAAKYRVHTY